MKCIVDFCDKEARTEKYELCPGHEWQLKHGKDFTPLRKWVRADIGVKGWRKCTKCGEVKKETEFYLRTNGYYYGNCKKCHYTPRSPANGV